jgi:hypothetical protein
VVAHFSTSSFVVPIVVAFGELVGVDAAFADAALVVAAHAAVAFVGDGPA